MFIHTPLLSYVNKCYNMRMFDDTVEEYLHQMLSAVLKCDKYFVILCDADNNAMTYHSENMPMEDVVSTVEQTLWRMDGRTDESGDTYREWYT